MNTLLNVLIHLRLIVADRLLWWTFLRETQDPATAQRRVLQSILRRNQATTFGRDHCFAEITTPEEYAARVPIRTYEDLRPYIERQEERKTSELVAAQPIMYARTSGTTGQAKYIPILPDTITRSRRSQRIFSCCHHAAIPGLFNGKTLAIVSPAVEGRLPTGTPYGSMSGLIYQSMPRLLRRKYLVPHVVFECANHELKYLLIATFALAERNITFMAGANPSTFLKIAEVIRTHREEIIAAVESGTLPGKQEWNASLHAAAQAQFCRNPKRAEELRALFCAQPEVTFSKLWPGLKAVSCWREGSCRVLLPALRRQLHENVAVVELGYLASECRGSMPVDSRWHLEVPTLHENYFEFVAREDWESGCHSVRALTQLEAGRAYYVIVTTPDGLYRYFMNDIVVVDGCFNRTPTIKFLEKGSGATNITGEKLYESQVCAAMEAVQRSRGWSAGFFLLVAEPEQQCYRFYLEEPDGNLDGLVAELDAELAARNLEYQAKRESGRLRPIELKVLRPGAGEAYKAYLVAQGQRESQFKFLRLQSRSKLAFDFESYLAASR